MRLTCCLLCALILLPCALADDPPAKGKSSAPELKTTLEQASYAIGLNIGRNLKRDGLDVNTAAIVQGLLDALGNVKPRLTDEQCQAALAALDKELQAALAAKDKVDGEKNRREGQAFLAANKLKSGVVTLPSGLQYTVLKSGTGARPTLKDVVRTHYHGTLVDGQVFDSSVDRGQPAVFQVGAVIKGWTEALQLMKVGDKWRLFVPPELAYGPQRASPLIGPHAVLVFDVELLGIDPQQ
jgi:FKBP-type peptidyl-prolyl cis-trans isomerase FklB